MGLIIGLLRVIPMSPKKKVDLIPADYSANAIICIMWDTVNRYQDTNQLQVKPKIFNYVSDVDNPITYGQFFKFVFDGYCKVPPLNAMWYFMFIPSDNSWVITILRFLLHRIPALLVDIYLKLIGKTPTMLNLYAKSDSLTDALYCFTTKDWIFDNHNVKELWMLLIPEDRMTFWYSLEGFNWKLYMKTYVNGIRKFMLKEDESNIEEALAKNRRLFWIHYLSITFIVLFVFIVLWMFIKIVLCKI